MLPGWSLGVCCIYNQSTLTHATPPLSFTHHSALAACWCYFQKAQTVTPRSILTESYSELLLFHNDALNQKKGHLVFTEMGRNVAPGLPGGQRNNPQTTSAVRLSLGPWL